MSDIPIVGLDLGWIVEPRRRLMAKLRNFSPLVRPFSKGPVQAFPKRALPFYQSPGWTQLKNEIIAERGRRCEDPEHNPRVPRASFVIYGDHIVEISDGGEPLDKSNILLRCPPCHGRKTVEQRKIRAGLV